MKNILLIAFLSLGLTACGAVPWNDQENAGLTDMHIYWGYDEANQIVYPSEIRVTDGKEAGEIDLKFQMQDGTVLNFNGTEIRAFEGQALRAEVERVIAEQVGDVAPGVVDAIIGAITGVAPVGSAVVGENE